MPSALGLVPISVSLLPEALKIEQTRDVDVLLRISWFDAGGRPESGESWAHQREASSVPRLPGLAPGSLTHFNPNQAAAGSLQKYQAQLDLAKSLTDNLHA